ncbi:calmodulin-like [Ylistrum balloti]|uniref:calmodulin-like n=1 Tax=Ylistrum balloti TaxID=509963 RepID=UPI002905AE93|nr:calmodulin-like [Ylistrum balloti]
MLANIQISPIQCKFSVKKSPAKMADLSVWTQRHLSRVVDDFDAADKDKSGTLTFGEVCDVLKVAGFKGTDEQAKRIFCELDTDKNNKISKNEFSKAMGRVPKVDFKILVLRRAFNKIDADGSGFLTRDEILKAASEDVGLNVTAEKISDMLLAITKDADKKISYDEFLDIWGKRQTSSVLRITFDKLDKDKSGTLTKDEMLAGIKSDEELSIQATTISSLLVKWCKGTSVSYEEFCRFYESVSNK